jgi:activating signal cointegrator complex subunit 2
MAGPDLLPLAPVPPAPVRQALPSDEWNSCLDAWILLVELRLRLCDTEFSSSMPKDSSTYPFLSSYFREHSSAILAHGAVQESKAKTLRRLCFLLVRRLLLDVRPVAPALLDWKFLGDFCATFASSQF